MLMDYNTSSQYTGSTLGSDTLSGAGSSSSTSRPSNRIRTVRLVRPNMGVWSASTGNIPLVGSRSCNSLGFGLRGGREHGTGFFVGLVERSSEAERQGLRVGDQIVRINGFTIEDAVHKEVLQLINNHNHLTLKVRSVGIIPVKEICKGPDWKPGIFIQFTKEGGISREAGLRPGDQILYCNGIDFGDIAFNEAVSIMKTSRQLDLIIRKAAGSELFPGESSGYNSSASSVTGDQSPSWSESKRLSIVKEENLDLEDRLISHLDHHHRFKPRNSKWEKIEWDDMETETLTDGTNSRTGLYQYKPTIINLSANGTTIKQNGSIEECQELEIEDLEKNSERHNQPQPRFIPPALLTAHNHPTTDALRPTNKYHPSPDNSPPQPPPEMRTVIVDVHRGSDVTDDTTQLRRQLRDVCSQKKPLVQQDSVSSYGSVTSRSSVVSATTSLSSAISQEIMRRSEKCMDSEKPSIDEQIQMKKILKGVDSDKQQQHSKLMDEFRQAHRKMFKSTENGGSNSESSDNDRNNAINRELNKKVSERLSAPISIQSQREEAAQDMLPSHNNTAKVLPVTTSTNAAVNGPQWRNSTINEGKAKDENGGNRSGTIVTPATSAGAGVHAPPPPPFPSRDLEQPISNVISITPKINPQPPAYQINGFHNTNGANTTTTNNSTIRSKIKAPPPPVPIKTSVLSHLQPPACPTPDYDTVSLSSNNPTLNRNTNSLRTTTSQQQKKVINNDSVEMESLDSFKMNKPYDATPRPPNIYFNKTKQNGVVPNGSAYAISNTVKERKARPVSITIGEYPSGTTRKTPGKLEFLQREDVEGEKNGTALFASELAMTLSRSNLRKRTESMENLLLNHPQMIKSQSNGSVRISVTNGLMHHRGNLAKSTNDLSNLDNLSRAFSAQTHKIRVTTINISPNHTNCQNDNTSLSSTCSSQSSSLSQSSSGTSRMMDVDVDKDRQQVPSGILKNGVNSCAIHKAVVQQKSITFGDMPTVINDQLRVT